MKAIEWQPDFKLQNRGGKVGGELATERLRALMRFVVAIVLILFFVLVLFFFLFGLSFQLWLNRMILHRTKPFAKPPDAPGGEGAPTPVPGTSAPGAAHESGEPGVRADSPASAQAGVKSVDPKAIFAAQSWRHSLIWQYCILLLFGAIELWTGVPHGQTSCPWRPNRHAIRPHTPFISSRRS